MRLLTLLERAKGAITGHGKWTKGELVQRDGSRCALGALDAGRGWNSEYGSASYYRLQDDPLTAKAIVLLAQESGAPSYGAWKKENGGSYQLYLEDCTEWVYEFNDAGTQRKVGGLFTRVIKKVRKVAAERRQKRLVKTIFEKALDERHEFVEKLKKKTFHESV